MVLGRTQVERVGRLVFEAPEASLGDDPPVRAGLVGVRGEGFVRVEMEIALDGKTERSACFAQFSHADEAEFGTAHTEIAEPEGDIVVAEFCQQPGALRISREEFHDGFEVDVSLAVIHADDLRLAVGDELLGLFLSEKCHVEVPIEYGPHWSGHKDPGPMGSE